MIHDLLLQGIADVEKCMQNVYIMSGCDFVSFFRGYGKKSFFDSFRKNAAFISITQQVMVVMVYVHFTS